MQLNIGVAVERIFLLDLVCPTDYTPVPFIREREGMGELYCFYQVNNCACHARLKRWEEKGEGARGVFGRSVDVEFYAPITNVGHK